MNIARVPLFVTIMHLQSNFFYKLIDVLLELQGNEKGKGVEHCLRLNDIETEITYLFWFNF